MRSLVTGSFTYQGVDQTAYADDFKQVNKVGGKDAQPVIDFVRWVNEAARQETRARSLRTSFGGS